MNNYVNTDFYRTAREMDIEKANEMLRNVIKL